MWNATLCLNGLISILQYNAVKWQIATTNLQEKLKKKQKLVAFFAQASITAYLYGNLNLSDQEVKQRGFINIALIN